MPMPSSNPQPRMRAIAAALAVLTLTSGLAGCAALETANRISDLYSTARGAQVAYHVKTMAKDLTQVPPSFTGYDSALIAVNLHPRKDQPGLAEAFQGNLAHYTQAVAGAVRAPLAVCLAMQACRGKVLVISFREDAYDQSLLQRFTVADRIRGRMVFTDIASGRITDERRVEMGEDYLSLVHLSAMFVQQGLVKSFLPATDAEAQRVSEAITRIPLVAPQYERILGSAS